MRSLVLLGAGHAQLEVLRRLARRPLPGWRVTLVSRAAASVYSGMVPGVLAGRYTPDQALIPLAPLAERAGATLVVDAVVGLDAAARRLRLAGGEALGWDLLSVNTGSTADLARVPGAAAHALPLKPIDGALDRLRAVTGHVAVVGGGAAGVEVALALRDRSAVTLVAAELLPGAAPALRRRVAAALRRRGVAVRAADAARVAPGAVHLADGSALAADAVVWAAGAAPPPWIAASGLPQGGAGFLAVDAALRVAGRPDILAAGDVADFTPALPKAGVVAVRQGAVLAHNLRAAATGGAVRRYRPQRNWLMLLSLGDGSAIGARNGLVAEGRWVWWWKDWIDRGFVARYRPR